MMAETTDQVVAEVTAVFPNRVRISVDDLLSFQSAEESLKVGSYLKISDNENVALICIIDSFSIEIKESHDGPVRVYIVEAYPLGTLNNGKFRRGGDELAIPPKRVTPASRDEIAAIYLNAFAPRKQFLFSRLAQRRDVPVPVDGNKFFNKHIAVVGATGSGKSHSVTSILQKATELGTKNYRGLNNSLIVIFDIHSEYSTAFPDARALGAVNLQLPYWLLNEDEMDELFLESGDRNNYNQESLLREVITLCKKVANPQLERVYFDSPVPYSFDSVINCLANLSNETKDSEDPLHVFTTDSEKTFASEEEKLVWYCEAVREFAAPQRASKERTGINKGPYADGSIDKFTKRLGSKKRNPRLDFLFSEANGDQTLESCLRQILGYETDARSNVVTIDLSGIPFDVLSITVSLITRLLTDFSYFYRRRFANCDVPLLLVYEEAHRYAPRSELARYRASLNAIERVAKEGRKYGTALLIASQRPSEISETIFSQCSNFIAMRLTNPDDQAYVRRLLPDTLGDITASLPSLEAGEALLIGDSAVMPSIVRIDPCDPEPSSSDVPYLEIWAQQWVDLDFEALADEWKQ